ncbi:hypothetical protein LIER_09438 [Lithospermum erythrorhizon]|uniref:Integrase catalytic domain-containing protein n=1 Tax=Lithospermum erythrorhizon TaxID=34254 RepID=A0AAV3PGV2_LITER
MCTRLGIEHRFASVCYPQYNGQVEVMNRTIFMGIKKNLLNLQVSAVIDIMHVVLVVLVEHARIPLGPRVNLVNAGSFSPAGMMAPLMSGEKGASPSNFVLVPRRICPATLTEKASISCRKAATAPGGALLSSYRLISSPYRWSVGVPGATAPNMESNPAHRPGVSTRAQSTFRMTDNLKKTIATTNPTKKDQNPLGISSVTRRPSLKALVQFSSNRT